MQLIYRGYSYTCTADQTKPTPPPCAVNWRCQLPVTTPIKTLSVNRFVSPRFVRLRAINWRYQILSEV